MFALLSLRQIRRGYKQTEFIAEIKETMSQINGDKSRFHRERKQNIHRRLRNRELLEAAGQKVPAAIPKKSGDGKSSSSEDKKLKAVPAN